MNTAATATTMQVPTLAEMMKLADEMDRKRKEMDKREEAMLQGLRDQGFVAFTRDIGGRKTFILDDRLIDKIPASSVPANPYDGLFGMPVMRDSAYTELSRTREWR